MVGNPVEREVVLKVLKAVLASRKDGLPSAQVEDKYQQITKGPIPLERFAPAEGILTLDEFLGTVEFAIKKNNRWCLRTTEKQEELLDTVLAEIPCDDEPHPFAQVVSSSSHSFSSVPQQAPEMEIPRLRSCGTKPPRPSVRVRQNQPAAQRQVPVAPIAAPAEYILEHDEPEPDGPEWLVQNAISSSDSESDEDDDNLPDWVLHPPDLVGLGSNGLRAHIPPNEYVKMNKVLWRRVPARGKTVRKFRELYSKEYGVALRKTGGANFGRLIDLFQTMPLVTCEISESRKKKEKAEDDYYVVKLRNPRPQKQKKNKDMFVRVPGHVIKKIREVLDPLHKAVPLHAFLRFYTRKHGCDIDWREMGFQKDLDLFRSLDNHCLTLVKDDAEVPPCWKVGSLSSCSTDYHMQSTVKVEDSISTDFKSVGSQEETSPAIAQQEQARSVRASPVGPHVQVIRATPQHQYQKQLFVCEETGESITAEYLSAAKTKSAETSNNMRAVMVMVVEFRSITDFTVVMCASQPEFIALCVEMKDFYESEPINGAFGYLDESDYAVGLPVACLFETEYCRCVIREADWEKDRVKIEYVDLHYVRRMWHSKRYMTFAEATKRLRFMPVRFMHLPSQAIECYYEDLLAPDSPQIDDDDWYDKMRQYHDLEIWATVESLDPQTGNYGILLTVPAHDGQEEQFLEEVLIEQGLAKKKKPSSEQPMDVVMAEEEIVEVELTPATACPIEEPMRSPSIPVAQTDGFVDLLPELSTEQMDQLKETCLFTMDMLKERVLEINESQEGDARVAYQSQLEEHLQLVRDSLASLRQFMETGPGAQ